MQDKKIIYLDNAATTPLDTRVFEKMKPYFGEEYGNPSSLYGKGRLAKSVVEKCRKGIAEILGAKSNEIIFTGSGTESDNLAILGIARANKKYGNHILISSIEHKAVLESAKQLEREGLEVEYIPVDKDGLVDVGDVMKMVRDDTILISVMYANNEIGTIEPIEELGSTLKSYRNENKKQFPIFHTDACQTTGYLPINVATLGVDAMTLNASKIYGPKGIGILYKKENVAIHPIIFGGGQEFGLRGGTENVALIVGLSEALVAVNEKREEESKRVSIVRDYLLKRLQETISGMVLNGHPTKRLPNNVHISIPNIEGESILLMLDEEGIQVSTGSACSSNDLEVSHVLDAIYSRPSLLPRSEFGNSDSAESDSTLAHGSIRFSLGKETTKEDIEYVIEKLVPIVKRLQSMSSLTLQKHER